MKIKQLALRVVRAGMSVCYAGMKLFVRPGNRVVFLSRQSDAPSEDFLMLAEKIKELSPDTECVFSCRLGLKSEMNASYIPLLLYQMKLLASAKACVTESYIPAISMLSHRRGMKVTQIWHSMVAIKKFGWQTVDTPEGSDSDTARVMCMHRGYDSIIAGSEYMIPFFAQAMNTPAEKVLPLGSPHADRLIATGQGGTRALFEEKYPQAKGRKIIAYLPTMRRGRKIDCEEFISSFDSSDSLLVVKLHPLDYDTVIDAEGVIVDTAFKTADVICASDAVVTDYSGTAADSAAIGVPVWFYLPDAEEYERQCGINVNGLQVFPEMSFEDGTQLARALRSDADHACVARQREYLAGGCDGSSTERIARVVLGITETA